MEDQPKVEDIRSTLSHFETYKGLPRCEEIKEWSVKSPQTVIILDDMILFSGRRNRCSPYLSDNGTTFQSDSFSVVSKSIPPGCLCKKHFTELSVC